jgi:hypothetical protein
LRLGDLLDFGQNHSGLVFNSGFHQLVITFGIFAGAMLESEIAKIVINRITAFQELIEFGAMRGEVGGIRVDIEDEQKYGKGQGEARAERGPVRDKGWWEGREKSDQHGLVLGFARGLGAGAIESRIGGGHSGGGRG